MYVAKNVQKDVLGIKDFVDMTVSRLGLFVLEENSQTNIIGQNIQTFESSMNLEGL